MKSKSGKRYLITGGAGFIGAHLANRLLDTTASEVVVYDNFKTGRRWHFGDRLKESRLQVVEADVSDQERLKAAMSGCDVVYHLAANSDIARAENDPGLDFWNSLCLTFHVLEAMRLVGVKRILFASGSGVYGDVPPDPLPEEYPRSIPVSTYGAAKLSGEAFISAYGHMFSFKGSVLRFANVVGPHQTHGVAYDFIRRLMKDPESLQIYGDGRQSKPYIHIGDVLDAFRLVEEKQSSGYEVFNVGTQDHLTVTRIAEIVTEKMRLKNVTFKYTGGARGWKADVPVYRLNTGKIRGWGWNNTMNSQEAVEAAVAAMLEDARAGRISPAD